MIVGTVRELKCEEYRVGLTPEGAHALVEDGHTVLVERKAGLGAGCPDAAYQTAGATLIPTRGRRLGAGRPAREGERAPRA